jgi:hypothetical protein
VNFCTLWKSLENQNLVGPAGHSPSTISFVSTLLQLSIVSTEKKSLHTICKSFDLHPDPD